MIDGHEDFLASGLTVCDGFTSLFTPVSTRATRIWSRFETCTLRI